MVARELRALSVASTAHEAETRLLKLRPADIEAVLPEVTLPDAALGRAVRIVRILKDAALGTIVVAFGTDLAHLEQGALVVDKTLTRTGTLTRIASTAAGDRLALIVADAPRATLVVLGKLEPPSTVHLPESHLVTRLRWTPAGDLLGIRLERLEDPSGRILVVNAGATTGREWFDRSPDVLDFVWGAAREDGAALVVNRRNITGTSTHLEVEERSSLFSMTSAGLGSEPLVADIDGANRLERSADGTLVVGSSTSMTFVPPVGERRTVTAPTGYSLACFCVQPGAAQRIAVAWASIDPHHEATAGPKSVLIAILDPRGSEVARWSAGGGAPSTLCWDPSGRRLLRVDGRAVAITNPDGSDGIAFDFEEGVGGGVVWLPPGELWWR